MPVFMNWNKQPGLTNLASMPSSKIKRTCLCRAFGTTLKSLDVIPAQWLRRQQSFFLKAFKVVPKALHKQVLFIFELGIEARFFNPGCLFQFMKTGISKPASPKNRQRLL